MLWNYLASKNIPGELFWNMGSRLGFLMICGCCIGLCVVVLFNVPSGILDWSKLHGIKESGWAFFLLVSFLQLGPGDENDLPIFSFERKGWKVEIVTVNRTVGICICVKSKPTGKSKHVVLGALYVYVCMLCCGCVPDVPGVALLWTSEQCSKDPFLWKLRNSLQI